jgi:flagella basal body P-ring formation protein FlgA
MIDSECRAGRPARSRTRNLHGRHARPCRLATRLAGVLLLLGASASAGPLQPHDAIESAAERHALQDARVLAPEGALIRAEADPIDPRLALAACAAPLETFSPPGNRGMQRTSVRASVGVRCTAEPGWSLFLPVRIEILTDVVVLAAPAARGAPLAREQLRLDRRDVAPLTSGYLTRIEDAQAKLLRRAIPVGTILTASLVEQPNLVERGQRVQVIATAAGFSISTYAEALADAAEGERVKVRNLSSRKVVEGVVDAEGRVRIGGPV